MCFTTEKEERKKTTGKGRREQEKHKALSSETADRLTGLLRLAETNIYRQSKGATVREGWREKLGKEKKAKWEQKKECF